MFSLSRGTRRLAKAGLSLSLMCALNAHQAALADQILDKSLQLASCTTCDEHVDAYGEIGCADGGCGDVCGVDLGMGGNSARGGQVVFGAEWISLRSTFSEATAYRQIDQRPPALESFEQFNFNYTDSFRVFGGYRLCGCGDEILFTYTRFNADGGFSSGPFNDPDVTFVGPAELVPGGLGDSISGVAKTTLDIYDLAYVKTIPLGSPLTSCDPCGDCCGSACPAWDLQWSGGLRVANVDSTLNYATNVLPANTDPNSSRSAQSRVSFDGVGLRAGVLGRRYFGRSGAVSAYVKGDLSLLLGDIDYTTAQTNSNFVPTSLSHTQLIPVTELEAGLSAYLTQNLSLTAGYMLSAWHDLGHRSEYNYGPSGTQTLSMDDANMMMFDGFFIRATAAF